PRKAQVMNMKRGGPLHVNGGSEISLSVTGGAGGCVPRGRERRYRGREAPSKRRECPRAANVRAGHEPKEARTSSGYCEPPTCVPPVIEDRKTPNRGNRSDRTGDTSQRPGGPGADA